jgi:hypothetical protein
MTQSSPKTEDFEAVKARALAAHKQAQANKDAKLQALGLNLFETQQKLTKVQQRKAELLQELEAKTTRHQEVRLSWFLRLFNRFPMWVPWHAGVPVYIALFLPSSGPAAHRYKSAPYQ